MYSLSAVLVSFRLLYLLETAKKERSMLETVEYKLAMKTQVAGARA